MLLLRTGTAQHDCRHLCWVDRLEMPLVVAANRPRICGGCAMVSAKALSLYDSTIGKKVVMAITGLILFGFVFIHMIGNLKIFKGQAEIDLYAEELRALGGPFFGHEQALWIARVILLVAVVLHI